VQEIPIEYFERVLPLVKASGMRGHLTLVYSVLEGRQTGRVFLDRMNHPRTCFFCNLNGFYFAFGEPDEEQVGPLLAEWQARPMSRELTALFSSSAAWDPLLSKLLPDRPMARLAFEYDPSRSTAGSWQDHIPGGFSVVPISEALAASIVDGTGTGNYGIDPWFIRIAGGPQSYADHQLGLAVVDEASGQIASICGFCALGGGEAELEVGTVPPYRGRGLATLVSTAFIDQCMKAGWRPAYTCASDNLPSIGVAHRLGFEKIEEIRGYGLPSL